jgi:hypothetical protein
MVGNVGKAPGEASAQPDRVGKVFVVLRHNLRICLVCEQVFDRQGAGQHHEVECQPIK